MSPNKPIPGPYDLGPFQEITAINWGGGEECPDGQWYFQFFDEPAGFGIQNFMFSDNPGNTICVGSPRGDFPLISNQTYIDQCGAGSGKIFTKPGLSSILYGLTSGAELSYFDICGSPDTEQDGIELPRLDGLANVAMQGQKWRGSAFTGTRLYYFGNSANTMASKGFLPGEKLIYGWKLTVLENTFRTFGNVLLPDCLFASSTWDHYRLRMRPKVLSTVTQPSIEYLSGMNLRFWGATSGAVMDFKYPPDCPDEFDPRNFAVDSTQFDYQWLDFPGTRLLANVWAGTAIDYGFIVGEDVYLTTSEP